MSDKKRYTTVVAAKNKIVRVPVDDVHRVTRPDINRVCEAITGKPEGFNFVGTTPDYTLVARTLRIDSATLQDQFQRGRDPNSHPDDRYCFEQLDRACASCELELVKEWRDGRLGSHQLLETYFRKYSKSYREHMELEQYNLLQTIQQIADEKTFERIINALRLQDPASQALQTYHHVHGLNADEDDVIDVEADDS
jgi:hypothetical protein